MDHVCDSAADFTTSFILRAGIEYAETDGNVIPPTPKWDLTPTAISLLMWDDKHYAAISSESFVLFRNFQLPDGLAICYDGEFELAHSIRDSKIQEKQIVKHYSVFPTIIMPVSKFVRLLTMLVQDNIVICDIMPGAAEQEDGDVDRDWNPDDYCSASGSILKGIELLLDSEICDAFSVWKMRSLHQMLLKEDWNRERLGANLSWSRVVAILLAQCEILDLASGSLAVRMSHVRNYIEILHDWDVQGCIDKKRSV